MAEFGTIPIGLRAVARPRRVKQVKHQVMKQAELSRDRSRIKLWQMRQRIKLKVIRSEEEMKRRKTGSRKSLNPTFVSLMPSRKSAKMIRNPANWSSIPPKPKYSGVDQRPRVYGNRRFEIWEMELSGKSRKMPRKYKAAAKEMAKSVEELRKEIAKRAKEMASEIKEETTS